MLGLSLGLGLSQRGGDVWTPAVLFAQGEPGGWYDPSDLSTMFQDSAGTTPVTATGQTVGLVLDKSKGAPAALGPELFANQPSALDNSGGGATVIHTAATRTVQVTIAGTGSSYPRLQVSVGMVTGRRYVVSGRIDGSRSLVSFVRLALIGVANNLAYNSVTGEFFGIQEAGASPVLEVLVNGTQLGTVTIATISVRELPGNHLTQANLANRAIYGIEPFGGRRNLLTFTEQFDNAAWTKSNATVTANAVVAPDGSQTAELLVDDSVSAPHRVLQSTGLLSADVRAFSVFAKKGTSNFVQLLVSNGSGNWITVIANLDTGAITQTGVGSTGSIISSSITDAGNGWYRVGMIGSVLNADTFRVCAVPAGSGNTLGAGGSVTYSGTGTGVYIWGAQLETGSTATAYQSVTDQWNVTEAGVPSVPYVQFDGSDDFYISPTITPGIDKAQVFAGVRKLSDAAQGIAAEFGSTTAAGFFSLQAPAFSPASNRYGFISWGSSIGVGGQALDTSALRAAPTTNVLTGTGDIAADTAILRVNGTQVASSATNQGTGNYLAYPLYVGRRAGTTLPYNGRLYSLIVRFGANLPLATIQQAESYTNSKTGAY